MSLKLSLCSFTSALTTLDMGSESSSSQGFYEGSLRPSARGFIPESASGRLKDALVETIGNSFSHMNQSQHADLT